MAYFRGMKIRLCIFLLLLASSPVLLAQQTFQADSATAAQNKSATTSEEIPTFRIKFFPFWLVQGVKLEAGYRFAPTWEINLTGHYYYRSFYWFSTYKSMTPTLYYRPTDGFAAFVSVDKNMGNGMHLLGFKTGYRSKMSDVFQAYNDFERVETVSQFKKEVLAMGIYRFRSTNKGFFVEYNVEVGVRATNLTQNVWDSKYNDHDVTENTYVYPHLLVGLAIGFAK